MLLEWVKDIIWFSNMSYWSNGAYTDLWCSCCMIYDVKWMVGLDPSNQSIIGPDTKFWKKVCFKFCAQFCRIYPAYYCLNRQYSNLHTNGLMDELVKCFSGLYVGNTYIQWEIVPHRVAKKETGKMSCIKAAASPSFNSYLSRPFG